MAVNRMLYVVYYQGKDVLKRLEKMPVNISFVSKKLGYVLFYAELDKEQTYLNHLKNIKGFKKLEQSPLYNEQLNYDNW